MAASATLPVRTSSPVLTSAPGVGPWETPFTKSKAARAGALCCNFAFHAPRRAFMAASRQA
eukprot:9880465-Alexandrium_andersonii.AAC.1